MNLFLLPVWDRPMCPPEDSVEGLGAGFQCISTGSSKISNQSAEPTKSNASFENRIHRDMKLSDRIPKYAVHPQTVYWGLFACVEDVEGGCGVGLVECIEVYNSRLFYCTTRKWQEECGYAGQTHSTPLSAMKMGTIAVCV